MRLVVVPPREARPLAELALVALHSLSNDLIYKYAINSYVDLCSYLVALLVGSAVGRILEHLPAYGAD